MSYKNWSVWHTTRLWVRSCGMCIFFADEWNHFSLLISHLPSNGVFTSVFSLLFLFCSVFSSILSLFLSVFFRLYSVWFCQSLQVKSSTQPPVLKLHPELLHYKMSVIIGSESSSFNLF